MSLVWSRCSACERHTLGARLCRQCRSALELAYQRAEMRRRYPVDGLEPPRVVAAPNPSHFPGRWAAVRADVAAVALEISLREGFCLMRRGQS
jgi:hypothetical protein